MAKARCKRYLQFLSSGKASEISGKNGFLTSAKGVKMTMKKESTSCRSKLKCFIKYLILRRENQKK
jgi:hypothetical protein